MNTVRPCELGQFNCNLSVTLYVAVRK